MNERNYFSRSWALLTRDKGWIKPLLAMTAASFVPIVGDLGNRGYGLEWARLTAWGVDSSPKQKNVDIGKCIGSGWRGFVVLLGWGFAYVLASGLIQGIVQVVPSAFGTLLSVLVSLALTFVGMFVGIVFNVAMIRASIYEKIGAGYAFSNIFAMVKRDFSGLLRVALVSLVCNLVASLVAAVFITVLALQLMPLIIAGNRYGNSEILRALSSNIVGIMLVCAIFAIVFSFLYSGINLIVITATALWMRQFDVPSWGRSEDPLPAAGTTTSAAYDQQSSYDQQSTYGRQSSYGQPTQHADQEPNTWQDSYSQSVQDDPYERPTHQDRAHHTQLTTPDAAPAGPNKVEVVPLVHVEAEDKGAATAATEPEPEVVPAPEPTVVTAPVAVPEPEPEVVPAPEVMPTPEPVGVDDLLEMGPDNSVPTEPVKDVDALYADLYDVIQRNNRTDD